MDANGAAANAGGIAVNMANITQYNSASYRNPPVTDGYATGQITGESTAAAYCSPTSATSRARPSARSPPANNEQGLQPSGGTTGETFASGQPGYDTAAGTLGSMVANSLEESNVNLTNET
jgi:flagellar hook protein FlgE